MSAYIVEDATINRVISWMYSKLKNEHSYLFNRFCQSAEVNPAEKDWPLKLGISMALLNDRAVNARYGEGTAEGDREGITYQFRWEPMTNRIQALKSLQCWHYQCSEGDVPETSELYKVANEVIGYLAQNIVSDLPEYNRSQWA